MFKLSAAIILCTWSGLAMADSHGDSTTSVSIKDVATPVSKQDIACEQLSALAASITSTEPSADLVNRASSLADVCGAAISPTCQVASRTWKTKAPATKFLALDGCQDLSSLNLGASCQATISQSLFTDKQISIERATLAKLGQDLQTKASVLYVKKKGCPEVYFQMRIQDGRNSLQAMKDDLAQAQGEYDKYTTGHFTTARYVANLAKYDATTTYQWLFKGIGPGPAFERKADYLSYVKERADILPPSILREQLEVGRAMQDRDLTNILSIDQLQKQRDDAIAAYTDQLEVVRALDNNQLGVINNDKSCSADEREKLMNEEIERTNGVGGIAVFDSEDMKIDLGALDQPVVMNGYAQDIKERGCNALRH